MDFIQTANKQVDKFGTGKHGFSAGNPAGGVPATYLSNAWCDNVQQEIVNLIEGAGLTVNPAQQNQIYQAVQALITGQAANDYKASVRFTTTGNITLSGLGTQAGGDWPGALTAGDRILPKDQTTGSQNGIYIAAAGAWTRATDADGVGELTSGAIVAVEEGTTNADSQWMLTTDGAITIGTSSLTFTRLGSSSNVSKLPSVGASVAANALTVTIGAESLDFRSATLTSGAPVTRTAGAQGSLTVPSGATLGTVSGQQSRLVWGWLDNAGTLEPFIVNLAGGNNLDETTLISTTAIGGTSNSANVIYSASARSNVAFRLRGFCDITEAAAGTWASAPSTVQPAGGQALAALSSSGYGQTWQDVTGSRSAGTTYYNTTGRPIDISIIGTGTAAAGCSLTINVSGASIGSPGCYGVGVPVQGYARVPPGASYSVTGLSNMTLTKWEELR